MAEWRAAVGSRKNWLDAAYQMGIQIYTKHWFGDSMYWERR